MEVIFVSRGYSHSPAINRVANKLKPFKEVSSAQKGLIQKEENRNCTQYFIKQIIGSKD